jgi:Xaa-Pro aminopeptidase
MRWRPESYTVEHFQERRDRLRSALSAEGVDAFLISNPVNVSYLTNFSGESSYLLLSKDRSLLVSDGRFTTQLAEECPGLEVHIRATGRSITQEACDVVKRLGLRSVGFESAYVTVAECDLFEQLAPAISWKGGKERVEKLRIVKDQTEVGEIREAIRFAEQAFNAFRAMLRPEDSEKMLADRLEEYVRRFGGRCTSFPSIEAAGERSALPHAPPTGRPLFDSDFLLVDWGASGRFYKSDLTRVLVTRKNLPFSRPSGTTKLEEIYAVVFKAQEQALRFLRPGIRAKEIDTQARQVIANAGLGDFFTHGLGHGIGLEIHEAPALRPNSEVILQAGMVVTIEPGVYLPGWGGIRIEDDALITPEGCEILTSVPQDLRSLSMDF